MIMENFFCGRENELEQFKKAILHWNTVGIVGMAGMGKTQFALKCIESFFDDNSIIWFDCFESSTIDLLIDACGYSYILRVENKTIYEKCKSFCELLEKDKRSIFLDNYEKIQDKESIGKFLAICSEYTRNSRIIIISKENSISKYMNITPIKISGLAEDSFEFAQRILSRYYCYINIDLEEVRKICNHLDGNPFGIKIALQLICNCGEELSTVSDIILEKGQNLEQINERLLSSILEHSNISILEKEFLLKFSIFNEKVTKGAMDYILDKKLYSDVLYGLINKSMISYSNGLFEMPSLIREFCYKRLKDKDFLHRTVAEYYKSKRTDKVNFFIEEKIFYHFMKAKLYEEISNTIIEKGSEFILLGYTELLLTMINSIRLAGRNRPELLFFLGSICEIKGDFEGSIKFFTEAYNNYEIDLNIGIFSIIKHGEILFKKGEMEQSLLKFNEALKLSTQFKYQLGIGCSLKGIGQVHFQNKNFKLALENFNENLIICTYIGDKSGIADAMKDLGLALIAQRKYEEGITYLNKSIVVYKEIGNEKSSDNYLALIQYIYSLEKSLEYKELKVNNSKLGRNDPCSCGSGKKYKNCCLGI